VGKGKAAVHKNIRPWLSAQHDCKEGRFLQVGNSLLFSPEYQRLPATARHLYLCMAMESGGRQEFTFPLRAARKYAIPQTTFERNMKVLKEHKFIKLIEPRQATPEDGDYRTIRPESRYRFSLEWKRE